MAEKSVELTQVGQEVQRGDGNLAFATAGLADDRVLAEILRLAPFDGTTIYKAVIGYTSTVSGGLTPMRQPVVVPSGSADGKIHVNPFRAVVGSRSTVTVGPSPNPTTDPIILANWRDVRSGIFVAPSGTTTLYQAILIAANASGNPRWDLVYATVAVDADQNTVSRRVKNPSTGAISTPSVPQYFTSPVTITVLQGTPGATPTLPALPADSAGNYNIPLTYVRVPNGFSASSTIAGTDLRTSVNGTGATPVSSYRSMGGDTVVEPATGNNDATGTYAISGDFAWNAATGPRPGPFMPNDWVGGKQILADLDLSNASSAHWSHQSLSVVDASIDWRNRRFRIDVYTCTAAAGHKFDHDPSGSTIRIPWSRVDGTTFSTNMGNSMAHDNTVTDGGADTSLISDQTNSNNTSIASGGEVSLYVNQVTGALKVFIGATAPTCRIQFWITATGQFPNL